MRQYLKAAHGMCPAAAQAMSAPREHARWPFHRLQRSKKHQFAGFTTLPIEGRSSEHCTDVARSIGVPVIHANADHPEAVVRALEVAADWRAAWQRDIIVDICGYRCGPAWGRCQVDSVSAGLAVGWPQARGV